MKTTVLSAIFLVFVIQLNAQISISDNSNGNKLDINMIDVGLTFIDLSPKFDDTLTGITKNLSVTVRIKNYSDTAIGNFQLEYLLLCPYCQPKIDTFTNTLNSGDSIDFTFTKIFHGPLSYYVIQAVVKLGPDMNRTNDTIRRMYYGYIDYAGFDPPKDNHFWLGQSRPNPAASQAQIDYFIPTAGRVEFRLYDALGRTLKANTISAMAGKNNIKVNTENFAKGIYYYTLRFDNQHITHKMIIGNY